MKPKLRYRYRRATDIMTVEGVRFAGEFFRTLGTHGPDVGAVLQVTERRDGVLMMKQLFRTAIEYDNPLFYLPAKERLEEIEAADV